MATIHVLELAGNFYTESHEIELSYCNGCREYYSPTPMSLTLVIEAAV